MSRFFALVVVLMVLAGCGSSGVESLTVVTRGTGECVYDGPVEVESGEHRLVIAPSAGGLMVSELHLLDEGSTYGDVDDYYFAGGASPPPFTSVVATVTRENSDTIASTTVNLSSGTYVIVCSTSGGQVVGPVGQVRATGSNG